MHDVARLSAVPSQAFACVAGQQISSPAGDMG